MHIESRDQSFSSWRSKLHEIIFEANTPAGKYFDIVLIVFIVLSVFCVMLDSVSEFRAAYSTPCTYAGVVFHPGIHRRVRIAADMRATPLALCDQFLRHRRSSSSILPAYLSLLIAGTHYLLVIRILRILRIFRILKLVTYLGKPGN